MSWSWITDSWGGPVNANDFYPGAAALTRGPNTAVVAANFPSPPLRTQTIPQSRVRSWDYEISPYLLLKDMSADKTPLAIQRGGYSGLPPTVEPMAHCADETASAKYYCPIGPNVRGPVLLGVYGPQ
jgi:hypothetical protein